MTSAETMTNTRPYRKHPQRAPLEIYDIWDNWSDGWGDRTWSAQRWMTNWQSDEWQCWYFSDNWELQIFRCDTGLVQCLSVIQENPTKTEVLIDQRVPLTSRRWRKSREVFKLPWDEQLFLSVYCSTCPNKCTLSHWTNKAHFGPTPQTRVCLFLHKIC